MKPKFSKGSLLALSQEALKLVSWSKDEFKRKKLEDMENFELGRITAYQDLIAFLNGEIKGLIRTPEELAAQKTNYINKDVLSAVSEAKNS